MAPILSNAIKHPMAEAQDIFAFIIILIIIHYYHIPKSTLIIINPIKYPKILYKNKIKISIQLPTLGGQLKTLI